MLVGYARTSKVEQEAGFEAQLRDLKGAGCRKVFKEQVSAVGKRAQLDAALDFVREEDTLVVTRLDRLARSVTHLGQVMDILAEKGVALRILNLGLDTGTPTGKLILTVMGGIAQFEREIMLERQREGIAKAKAAGRFKGRPTTVAAKAEEIRALAATGMSMGKIAAQVGVGKGSVHRLLKPKAS